MGASLIAVVLRESSEEESRSEAASSPLSCTRSARLLVARRRVGAAQVLSQLEADKTQIQRLPAAPLDDDLPDRLFRIFHEGLLRQNRLLVELFDLSFRDALDNLRGLARGGRLRAGDLPFGREHLGRDFRARGETRVGGRDVHREVLAERVVAALKTHEDADPPVAMDVGREPLARSRRQPREPPDADVLSELGDQVRDGFGHGLAGLGGSGQLQQSRRIARSRFSECRVRRDQIGHAFSQAAEVGCPRDEVRLAVDLDQHGRPGRHAGHDQSLRRRPVRLTRRSRQTPFAKDLAGLFEVAVGFHQRFLAIHHTDAGLGAQIRHRFGRNFHGSPMTFSCPRSNVQGPRQPRTGSLLWTLDFGLGYYEATSDTTAVVESSGVRGLDSSASASLTAPRSSWACRPSRTASETRDANSRIARMASSLPGITWSITSGSQLVSTTATTGMPRMFASLTAMYSCFGSMTNKASGSSSISLIPVRFFSSFSFSRSSRSRSFLVRFSLSSWARVASISFKRWMDLRSSRSWSACRRATVCSRRTSR